MRIRATLVAYVGLRVNGLIFLLRQTVYHFLSLLWDRFHSCIYTLMVSYGVVVLVGLMLFVTYTGL